MSNRHRLREACAVSPQRRSKRNRKDENPGTLELKQGLLCYLYHIEIVLPLTLISPTNIYLPGLP